MSKEKETKAPTFDNVKKAVDEMKEKVETAVEAVVEESLKLPAQQVILTLTADSAEETGIAISFDPPLCGKEAYENLTMTEKQLQHTAGKMAENLIEVINKKGAA